MFFLQNVLENILFSYINTARALQNGFHVAQSLLYRFTIESIQLFHSNDLLKPARLLDSEKHARTHAVMCEETLRRADKGYDATITDPCL
jgi:hypothetical protein